MLGHAKSCDFQVASKDVTGEILFGDLRMFPPSLSIHLSKLVWLKRIQQLLNDQWISATNSIHLGGTRGVGRPRT
jgi:hypothetical protein